MSDTRTRILHLLKSKGDQETASIAAALGITSVGTRQHLTQLADVGLVAAKDVGGHVGRPRKFWHLLAAARAQFPDGHENLTLEMIEAVGDLFGEAGLEKMIQRREAKTLSVYAERLEGISPLGARVKKLARLRSDEGYMAEASREADGGWLLIENHCPICVAAEACQGFCRSELETFRRVLGPEVCVDRIEHVLSGARRCAYRVTKNSDQKN